MSERPTLPPPRPPPPPRNVLPDLVIPVLAVSFTIYYLTTITGVPWIAQASAVTVSVLLFTAIAAYAVRTALRIRAGRERIALERRGVRLGVEARRLMLLALTAAYVFVIDHLGFTITTFSFVFLGIVVLSSAANWRRALAVSLACSVLGYVVFIYFFHTRFPRGPIENFLRGVL